MEALIVAISALSIMAFGIACTTLAYSVHEFGRIREVNERMLKHMDEGHQNLARILERMDRGQRNTTRILERIAERLK